jgi:hypothetical protein
MANSTTLYTLSDGRRAVDVTEAKTLAITDQGTVQVVKTDAIAVTLPATVVGYTFTVMNGGAKISSTGPTGAVSDGSVKVSISPNSVDLIAGGEIATAADDKDYINTKATSHVGDEVTLVGNGTTGWNVTRQKGIWARES